MSTRRISGRSFDTNLLGAFVHVGTLTANITNSSEVATSGGVPDGYTQGSMSCEVEAEIDVKTFNRVVHDAAKKAGSYSDLPLDDLMCYANTGDEEQKCEFYGVKWLVEDLLNIDPSSTDKSMVKLKGLVTSPLFVKINGVPVLSATDTRHLL
ncbi:DUF2597 family protein [Vibrio lamellibrachiae]|uniref:phage protein n=1 Tax=Vibrio lamellibrachiae TaxID=2910253 RepID=UPI003D0AC174